MGKNRYLFPSIIKFLDQALKAKCFIRKTHTNMEISKTHSWKSQQDTEPTLLLRAGGENRDVFHNCKNLGIDYYVNIIIIIILISSFPSVRCCLEQCFFPINIASLSLCKSHAAPPAQVLVIQENRGKFKNHIIFSLFFTATLQWVTAHMSLRYNQNENYAVLPI